MQPHIKAVIFDLDGVIIDSNPAIEMFWKSWTDRENITLTSEMICEWVYGRKISDTISGIFDHLHDDRKTEIYTSAHEFDGSMQPSPMAGVADFIQMLTHLRVSISVVTSSHHSRMMTMLEYVGLGSSFTQFVTGHDVSKGKPHPEPYEKMREKLGLRCEECLVFEDAISGIQSAKAAGMYAIGIGNSITAPGLLAAGANDIIPDFSTLAFDDRLLTATKSSFRLFSV